MLRLIFNFVARFVGSFESKRSLKTSISFDELKPNACCSFFIHMSYFLSD